MYLVFSFKFDYGIRISEFYTAETYKVLNAECQTAELSRRHIPRTVLSWETDWLPYSIRIRNEVTVTLHSNKAYPKQWTILAVKARFTKRPIQLLQNVSSSVSFSTLPNSLVWFWILYLWVKCIQKNSILQINSVQSVYVESCYKLYTSTYKKAFYNIDISNVSDLPFD